MHANGEVKAKVWYSQKVQVPMKQSKKVQTGNEESGYCVNINNFKINFAKRVPKFENYDTIETSKKLRLFSDFYLPIEIQKITYQEYINSEIFYTVEEAKNIAIEEAKGNLDNQIENKENILNQKINFEQTQNNVDVEVIYEVLENIATKEKIIF